MTDTSEMHRRYIYPRPERLRLDVIVPVYNEEESLDIFFAAMDEQAQRLERTDIFYIFVDDGSADGTLPQLVRKAGERDDVLVIELSRNFGKEAALSAGIAASTGDAAVPMDVDLQDPPALLPELIAEWRKGYDVVVAQRTDRSSDGSLKRATSSGFYKAFNMVAAVPIPAEVGDYRLMDRRVVAEITALKESNRFMKGLMSWVGFPTAIVPYSRPLRAASVSSWNYRKLFNLALDGIFSFSGVPLKIWSLAGVVFALAGFLYGMFILVRTLIYGIDLPGYASIMVVMLFAFGIQMISIGVLSEYVARIHIEVKNRPIWIERGRYGARVATDLSSAGEE